MNEFKQQNAEYEKPDYSGIIRETRSFLTGFAVRWVLKIAGTYFATIGIENRTLEEIIGGLLAIISGIVISLFQHKKALETNPSTLNQK